MFAGEGLGQEVVWEPSQPQLFGSDCRGPSDDAPARIRLRKTYRSGADKGKDRSFDSLWSSAVFELYNVANARDFNRISSDAAEGRLDKQTFVAKYIGCESRAAEKTRVFYIRIFLPWAAEHRVPTEPERWFVA